MSYIIYSNITSKDFDQLYERIALLRQPFELGLSGNKYKLTTKYLADILGLDFTCKDGRYHGNIGFLFNDTPGLYTFTFYITKSFDENKRRHFKKIQIVEHVDLEFIENNYESLLNDALKVYSSLKDEDLDTIIKL
ncbi:hypothetical protein [Pinibacter aurantiacus]|uniref:Uncharacterized protein n=1 Tax=Pinibacter aurantiacus TaxID=2851599 RepID=A0A9E2S763_9BACT|nr:hypothetical protein [Pinibacter aurantiacus]MBV4355994.1 hypothetical protein [Pinibacter aurantiacus]